MNESWGCDRTLLTETPGFFSLTHDGTVVTKPKLKRIVPRTAACEPYVGSVLTAGSDLHGDHYQGRRGEVVRSRHRSSRGCLNFVRRFVGFNVDEKVH